MARCVHVHRAAAEHGDGGRAAVGGMQPVLMLAYAHVARAAKRLHAAAVCPCARAAVPVKHLPNTSRHTTVYD